MVSLWWKSDLPTERDGIKHQECVKSCWLGPWWVSVLGSHAEMLQEKREVEELGSEGKESMRARTNTGSKFLAPQVVSGRVSDRVLLDPLPAQDISWDGRHLGMGLPCTGFPGGIPMTLDLTLLLRV